MYKSVKIKRAILILHRYPPQQITGTNACFLLFLEEIAKNGYKIFYLTFKEKPRSASPPKINLVNLPFYFYRGSRFDKTIKTYLWILIVPFYVFYFKKKYNIDIIYCDDSVPFYSFFCKLLNPRSKIIIRLGDLQTSYLLEDNHPILFKIIFKIELFMWSKMQGIIAISDSFKNFIIRSGLNPKTISVVEENVNLEKDQTLPPKFHSPKKVVFGFHGTLEKCKGLKTLLRAFQKVNEQYPHTRLIIAGGGSEEKKLKSLMRKQSIKNVSFTGWYDHNSLKTVMNSFDIGVVMRNKNLANDFILTTCLLENWKYRKPVLVPDLQTFKLNIRDRKNGIFYKTGDENDLAKKMIFLIQNQRKWKGLGELGFQTAQKKFSHRKIARKMVKTLLSYK